MNAHVIPEDFGEIKPGNRLSSPEWSDTTRTMTMEERGFALLVVTLMHLRGWKHFADLPDDDDLASDLRAKPREVRRLRRCLHDIPQDVLAGQLHRIRRWPAWIKQEFAP